VTPILPQRAHLDHIRRLQSSGRKLRPSWIATGVRTRILRTGVVLDDGAPADSLVSGILNFDVVVVAARDLAFGDHRSEPHIAISFPI
jgi:hypothetical protein